MAGKRSATSSFADSSSSGCTSYVGIPVLLRNDSSPVREAASRASEALNGAVSDPSWQTRPSWYLVAADDRMIPPPAQRAMAERAGATVAEAPGSHSIYVSRPDAVVDLIKQATTG
ncbi:alpha/beta fold hydrolase [Streptomyces pseudovenezuelae]|uniref:alpha/beta fold hydrolase n=1 Tax=Streptomyces pseudovenezuelae TaxID=67350 RepID=UPI002475ED20|nr:alpha/beta hydrolase [Streptomyces pseudovenezuelae]